MTDSPRPVHAACNKAVSADMEDMVFNHFEVFLFGRIQQERRPNCALCTYEDHFLRKTKVLTEDIYNDFCDFLMDLPWSRPPRLT
jgi:hypothetical protein